MCIRDRETVGTRIILHLNEDSYEFANEYRVREVLDKYCSFMPVEIFLTKANAEPEYETIPSEEVTEEDTVCLLYTSGDCRPSLSAGWNSEDEFSNERTCSDFVKFRNYEDGERPCFAVILGAKQCGIGKAGAA